MKSRTNVTPIGKEKQKTTKGYAKVNLRSRKGKDKRTIAIAGKSEKGKYVFIKSKKKLDNPDKTSDQKKMQRGDALYVSAGKKNGWKVPANMRTYKYSKNLADK